MCIFFCRSLLPHLCCQTRAATSKRDRQSETIFKPNTRYSPSLRIPTTDKPSTRASQIQHEAEPGTGQGQRGGWRGGGVGVASHRHGGVEEHPDHLYQLPCWGVAVHEGSERAVLQCLVSGRNAKTVSIWWSQLRKWRDCRWTWARSAWTTSSTMWRSAQVSRSPSLSCRASSTGDQRAYFWAFNQYQMLCR